jgi:hypothetical protein
MKGQTRDYKSYELEQAPTEIMQENRIGEIIGSDGDDVSSSRRSVHPM